MSEQISEWSTAVLDLMQESVVLLDCKARIVHWNAAAQALYGRCIDDVRGLRIDAVLQTRGGPLLDASDAAGKLDGWQGDVQRIAANGTDVTVRLRCTVRHDRDGAALDIVETGVDITAQKQAEDALRRTEHRYFNLYQAAAVSFWELDFSVVAAKVRNLASLGVKDLRTYFSAHPEFVHELIKATRVLDVNDQCVRMFGRGDKNELLGDLSRFWPLHSYRVFAESVIAAFSGMPGYAAEASFVTLRGDHVDTWFTSSFSPDMLARGKILVGIIDLSASKAAMSALFASEQRYRKLFQFVPVSLIQIDRAELANHFAALRAQGVTDLAKHIEATPGFVDMALNSIRIVEVNWKTVELFGAHDAAELLGPVARLWTESRDTFQHSMQTVYNGGASFQGEIRIRTFTGQVVDVLYVTDFPEAAREPALGLACLVDISERVRAQQALAKTQAEFAHAARVSVLGELTASIVHEVNQPLCAVLSNAEAALRWIDRPEPNLGEVRTLSTRIIRDVSRAAEIVQRIRALAGGKEPERLPVELNRMIEEVMVFLSPELARQDVQATLELDPQQPCVLGDRVQLQQVLVNMAVNAIHAMASRGSGARRLVIRTRNDRLSLVRVELEDTGPGIAADHLDHLFKSFFTTKADGMGIGLAICRSIIDAHGGRITAENLAAPGGARFSFSLPACA
ncbi:ATP-binding protein [Paraburkholderia sp. BCC1885]|uniref:PAS domain-containing sensor histidine kinase n=1 Tax=Paraburkholderia sp. BCC1885 TaxID=2562669 RepID=UPI001182277C|nr:ATP-binding protein [Paraburkholderia sp. BCC1885]